MRNESNDELTWSRKSVEVSQRSAIKDAKRSGIGLDAAWYWGRERAKKGVILIQREMYIRLKKKRERKTERQRQINKERQRERQKERERPRERSGT